MVKPIPTALALLVVVLFGIALFSWSAGNIAIAGVCFFSMSIVIFLRARLLQRESGPD
jgi:hypothetical protein